MKETQKAALRARAETVIAELYHAATPAWPRDFGPYGDDFGDWLADAASFEIEHLNSGGAYGKNYRRTLERNAEAKGLSEAATAVYIRHGMRQMVQDRARFARFEWAPELFGELYTYGRGGRTLARCRLVRTYGGGSFGMDRDALESYGMRHLTEAVQVLESFLDYVRAWCAGVPDQWAEYTADRLDDAERQANELELMAG